MKTRRNAARIAHYCITCCDNAQQCDFGEPPLYGTPQHQFGLQQDLLLARGGMLWVNPDCGLKPANVKLVEAARRLRNSGGAAVAAQ